METKDDRSRRKCCMKQNAVELFFQLQYMNLALVKNIIYKNTVEILNLIENKLKINDETKMYAQY